MIATLYSYLQEEYEKFLSKSVGDLRSKLLNVPENS